LSAGKKVRKQFSSVHQAIINFQFPFVFSRFRISLLVHVVWASADPRFAVLSPGDWRGEMPMVVALAESTFVVVELQVEERTQGVGALGALRLITC